MADAPPTEPSYRAPSPRRVAVAIYLAAVLVYALFAGDRLRTHSPDNHFAYLADSFLHRTLEVRCNDDLAHHVACPPGNGGNDWARYNGRWFVAFPPFPAVLYLAPVAVLGRDFPNRAYDVLLAGIAPALLFLLLDALARRGLSARTFRENLGLTALFAFGTVFFFTAVQGAVWFTAHVVAVALAAGFVLASLDARSPLLAGMLAGMALHTRPPMLLMCLFFGLEAVRAHRLGAGPEVPSDAWLPRFGAYLRETDWRAVLRKVAVFAVPVVIALALSMAFNKARFGATGETGYQYLQIRWQARIQRWGLFNFHYLSRNLAVALALLPWITRSAPFVQISRHGLALWVTTPQYLGLLHPSRRSAVGVHLLVTAAAVACLDLLYQNSGWVQFGYRFSNDYAVLLVAALAVLGRSWKKGAWLLLAVAIAVNTFGAATFDRPNAVYQGDNTADGMFQPD